MEGEWAGGAGNDGEGSGVRELGYGRWVGGRRRE